MGWFIARRTVQTVVAMLGASVVVFALIHLAEGDPIRAGLGPRYTEAAYLALLERSGLDRPLHIQYVAWLGGVLTGDLGVSFRSGQPVAASIAQRLPATALLAAASLVIGLLIAIPAGVIAAVRQGKASDYAATTFSQVGVSIPDFWMAMMLILIFAVTLGWLPPFGYVSPLEDPVQSLRRLVMPALTAGVVTGAILTRYVRSSVLEAMNSDHVRFARAKGLSSGEVLRRHVLRNAWNPIVTMTGLQLSTLLGGIVVVEIIFTWPGIGRLAFDAVERRDYPLLQGAVLTMALTFLVVNLIVDLLYAKLDPRIRVR